MSNFKIGEKVVALCSQKDKGAQPRKKGEIYTITDIYVCVHGIVNLNVNNQFGEHKAIDCNCGCEISSSKFFTNSKYFRKLDYSFGEKICAEILESVKVKQEQLN